jgi:hypothetical protein
MLSLYLITYHTMKTERQTCKVIQEERSVFWKVNVRKKVHMNVSNSEWLPRYSCLNLDTKALSMVTEKDKLFTVNFISILF